MFSSASQQKATQQVIGAAAQDPRVQSAVASAAKDAAQDPRIQQAVWDSARGQAGAVAQQGAAKAREGVLEVKAYIQESNWSIRTYCFCAALALFLSSILGVLNVFDAVFSPYQYVMAVYNVFFAGLIIIIDGKREWFRRCGDLQSRIYMQAAFLASWAGRAVLYFYVGSINVVMLPDSWLWQVVYIAIGAVLCSIAFLMMLQGCGCLCCDAVSSSDVRQQSGQPQPVPPA